MPSCRATARSTARASTQDGRVVAAMRLYEEPADPAAEESENIPRYRDARGCMDAVAVLEGMYTRSQSPAASSQLELPMETPGSLYQRMTPEEEGSPAQPSHSFNQQSPSDPRSLGIPVTSSSPPGRRGG
ncbi:uncharacterized protein LOC144104048 [Amblyomma americanum]